jgi:uncharacterized protein YcbK (DUF882 family)
MSTIHGYADHPNGLSAASRAEGRALDLRIADVECADIEHLLAQPPRLLARVGCIANARFFHIDAGRSRGTCF